MKIVFFETKPWQEKYLKKKLKSYELEFYREPLTEDNANMAKDADVVSVFIYSTLDKNVLSLLKKIKMIATRSTGTDHIDSAYCNKKGIDVKNVPFYGENTVAEHTFALILSLSRKVHKSYVRTLDNNFSNEGLTGFDLKGKTLGVVGGGHIGMHVVKIAKGFGMDVLVFDVNHDSLLEDVLDFRYAKLNDLLKNSDIISFHVPHNKHTHHLINNENIQYVKKGAILINTARGAIVDTEALLDALEKGKIGGAGLDVIEGEELIKEENQLLHSSDNIENWRTIVRDHKIFKMDNVVFTPHIGFNSEEALTRILDTTIENILGFQ